MKYGGHQTFPIREGWLAKALELMETDPEAFLSTKDMPAALGVGSNMAKSIDHWLRAADLAYKNSTKEARETGRKYEPRPLASIIRQYDPYFTLEESWWLIHIQLIHNSSDAATWEWFFNEFSENRFEKSDITARLKQREDQLMGRTPSQTTLDRDVSCFLNTYAEPIPRENKDPEEDLGSPFQELKLMSHLRSSGTYEVHRQSRKIRPELLLYSILKVLGAEGHEPGEEYDFTFSWLTKQRSGPLQAFLLTTEGLFEQVMALEQAGKDYGFQIRGLAGDRQIVFTNPGTEPLLAAMYERIA